MMCLSRVSLRSVFCCLVLGLACLVGTAQSLVTAKRTAGRSQLAVTEYYWDCETTMPASGSDAGISSVMFSSAAGNNNGTTTLITTVSKSTGYTGASGNSNFGAAAKVGAADTSQNAYFEMTIAPASGRSVAISEIDLGSRSTGTGPRTIFIRSSLDGFASDIASFAVPETNTWNFYQAELGIAADPDIPIVLRIFGANGVGTPGANTANWRIDDIHLFATGLLAPTAADAVVAGQVVDGFGSGISGAVVTLMSPTGERRTVITSSFGYFRFSAVETGETYVVAASSKRHRFQPRSVTVADNIDDLRITALP